MRFQYLQVGPKDFAPIIPLNIKGKDGWIAFEVYVDSGATYSIFHSSRAEILDLNFKKGKKILVTVGDGQQIGVYLWQMKVRLGDDSFKATIGFSGELGVNFNLLGRKSFFDRYLICFNDKNKYIEFS